MIVDQTCLVGMIAVQHYDSYYKWGSPARFTETRPASVLPSNPYNFARSFGCAIIALLVRCTGRTKQWLLRIGMSDGKPGLRRLSTGLIAAGIVVVLAVGGYLILSQVRGAQTRRDLRQTPPAVETSAPVAQTTEAVTVVAPATIAPTATPIEPAPTATEAPASTEPARRPLPSATPAPAEAAAATAPPPEATAVPPAPPVVASAPVRMVIPDLKIDVPVVEMGWRVVQSADWPALRLGHPPERSRASHQQRPARGRRQCGDLRPQQHPWRGFQADQLCLG